MLHVEQRRFARHLPLPEASFQDLRGHVNLDEPSPRWCVAERGEVPGESLRARAGELRTSLDDKTPNAKDVS